MKCAAVLLLCAVASANAGAAGNHPIVKVIKLLEGLKDTSISEGKAEAVAYSKFTYYCSTTQAELKDAIAAEEELIDELKDTIAGKTKVKENLEGKISELEDQLKDLQASAKSAKDDRAADAALYEKANKDLTSTITAVDGCIKALQGAESSTEPTMLLAQQQVKGLVALIETKVSKHQLNSLRAFADPKSVKAEGDLAKHTDKYDFKSENVIELLKNLKLKFEDDQLALTKAETNNLNAYTLEKEARDNTIDAADNSKKKQEKALADTKADISAAGKKKKDTESDHDADTKGLSDTQSSCNTKASEWQERSSTRENEIKAMEVAIKILGKASGVRTEAPGNPIPPSSPVKFLQLLQQPATDGKMKAIALLREAAKDAHSKALERLAIAVSAHLNGPFDAVNNMIEKMIFRLMDEQKQEDEHKLWCDQEIEKTNTMKGNKEDKIKELKLEIGVQKTTVGQLTEEIKDANKMVSDITGFMKEATEIRNTGKKENALAIKDAEDAQKAVSNAIAVLEAFYKESGAIKKEDWEFIQKAPVKLPKDPATWDSPYTNVADPSAQPGGIVTVLKAISSDFSKMEADTRSQENVDQHEYEEAIKANKIELARRSKEVDMKTAEKARRNDKITSLESVKKDTSAELEKTNQYLTDLKPACVDGDSSYTDRKAARTKEIEALKKAQVTLQEAFEAKGATKFLQLRAVSRHQ